MASGSTCGEALVRLLQDYGVDTVFGIPGVHTLELYRGLAGNAVRHVQPRHEQGAGFMADGYARASGKPGVCFLITGPGVTNAATAMGQAYSNSVPMLVISSVNARRDLGKGWGRLHEITDQRASTAPLTAFSATALSPADVPDLLARAFDVFQSSRPRPVHIEVPIDVFPLEVTEAWRAAVAAQRPSPPAESLDQAATLLAGAKRPAIVAGGGAIEAGEALTGLAALLGAAVATTTAGKGILPDSHPLSLGSTLSQALTQDYLAEADVVLAIGTELAETDLWRGDLPLPGKLIRVDIDPGKMNDRHKASIPVLGDAAVTARALLASLEASGETSPAKETAERVAELRRGMLAALSPRDAAFKRILERVSACLPDDAMVFTDMTQIAYFGNRFYPAERPGTWFHPVGFGTLGYALPAAIGAKLAAPERATVALAGDGGFMFTLQELATAVELSLPVPLLLWNNEAYGQILEDMTAKGIPEIGVRPRNPDFQALAAAFGCGAAKPETLDQLGEALSGALEATGPTLIELRHDAASLV
jgi:thiamine pyrophosphate-dependent acetolactate synthase large subunit-like protein